MRIVYYTQTSFLDCALSFVQSLSQIAEVHLILELPREGWRASLFDKEYVHLPEGLLEISQLRQPLFEPELLEYVKDVKSFHLNVYGHPRALTYSAFKNSKRALSFIETLNPDIAHFDDLSIRMCLAFLKMRKRKFSLVANVHDPIAHTGEESLKKNFFGNIWFRNVDKFVLFNKSMVNVFCKSHGIPVERVFASRLGVYAIRAADTKKGKWESEEYVTFIGRISRYKGLPVFLESAGIVSKEIAGCKFILAGRSIPGYRLPSIPSLENGGSIEVINDYLSNSQLASVFLRSSMIVCPYLDASQSGVILTAYAFGKPVIATNVGGLREYVWDGRTGILIEPNSPKQLAKAIISLLRNQDVRNRMKEEIAGISANELSWDVIAGAHLRMYDQLQRSLD